MSNDDGRIKTRSRARQSTYSELLELTSTSPLLERLHKQYSLSTDPEPRPLDPDQYTIIPAPLKIVKLLLDEHLSAAGQNAAANAASAAIAAAVEEGDDEEGWEDEDDTLDLGAAAVKNDLMSYLDGPGHRQRDDETNTFLTDFFVKCGRENTAEFQKWYEMLSADDQLKLQNLASTG